MKEYTLYCSLIPQKIEIECDSVGISKPVRRAYHFIWKDIRRAIVCITQRLIYLTFSVCGNCEKFPYFIGEVSASFSVDTFTNTFNSIPLNKRRNWNKCDFYLLQTVATEKKDITVKIICPVFILGNTCLVSISLNKKFPLSIAGSVCRQWAFSYFLLIVLSRQVDIFAFFYLFRIMIRRFPCILFVSDVAHFWYVAALKIGSLVAHSVAVSPTTLTLGFLFVSQGFGLLFICYLFSDVLFYSVQSQWRRVSVQSVER